MPDVSVIVPVYNRRDLACEAVASVLVQGGVSVEVIVVDDGSTDGSAAAVREQFPHVIVISQDNAGAPAARNRGLTAATGEFVKFLDSDDLLAPRVLERQVAALRDSGADAVYGDFEMFGNRRDARAGGRLWRATEHQDDMIAALLGDWWCASFCYLYRRDALDGIRWREDLGCLQDFDFVLNVAMGGVRFEYVPGVDGYYRIHGGQITEGSALKYARNRRLVLDDCLARLRATGILTPRRKQMLAHGYWSMGQAFFGQDPESFRYSVGMVRELAGRWFFPRFWGTLPVRLLTLLLGIAVAEGARARVRSLKRLR